jgi:hypothetical protein
VGSYDNVNDIVIAMKVFQQEEAHAFPEVKLHINIDTSMIAYDGMAAAFLFVDYQIRNLWFF